MHQIDEYMENISYNILQFHTNYDTRIINKYIYKTYPYINMITIPRFITWSERKAGQCQDVEYFCYDSVCIKFTTDRRTYKERVLTYVYTARIKPNVDLYREFFFFNSEHITFRYMFSFF